MGFLDILRGKRELKQPAADRLFAMSTAYVKLEMELEMRSAGKAAIVFQPLATADFEGIVKDMEEVVRGTGEETGTTVSSTDDEFGYRWMILSDPDMEDLVVGVNAVSTAIQAGGYGDRVLCAVFALRDQRDKRIYWIYNYKRGSFYPFVPAGGRAAARQRARAAAEGPDRRRPAGRARARALVPPLGHPDLVSSGSSSSPCPARCSSCILKLPEHLPVNGFTMPAVARSGARIDLERTRGDSELAELERDLRAERALGRLDPALAEADQIIVAAPAQPQALLRALLRAGVGEPGRDLFAAEAAGEDLRAALVVVQRQPARERLGARLRGGAADRDALRQPDREPARGDQGRCGAPLNGTPVSMSALPLRRRLALPVAMDVAFGIAAGSLDGGGGGVKQPSIRPETRGRGPSDPGIRRRPSRCRDSR